MQRKINQRKEELKETSYSASSGNDRVTVTVNGEQQLLSIAVEPDAIAEEGLELVQDLIVAATNAALTKSKDDVEAEIEKITGGMKIPGLV